MSLELGAGAGKEQGSFRLLPSVELGAELERGQLSWSSTDAWSNAHALQSLLKSQDRAPTLTLSPRHHKRKDYSVGVYKKATWHRTSTGTSALLLSRRPSPLDSDLRYSSVESAVSLSKHAIC